MSYLDPGQRRLNFLAATATSLLSPKPRCVRCSGSLAAASNLPGTCTHCAIELAEEDDALDAYAIRHGNGPSWG